MNHERRVANAVYGMTKSWASAPNISVVAHAAALPFHTPFPILGALSDDEVFIVAAEQSPDKAMSTTAHEVVGHHGFRQMLGQHWHRYMTHVLGAIHSGEPTLRLAQEVVREVYVDATGQCNLAPIDEADECVARVTEWVFNPTSGKFEIEEPLRKQLLALANHVGREALHLDIPLTRGELEGAILASAETVRHGAPLRGFGKWLPGWYASAMRKPMGASTPPRDWTESKMLLEAERFREGAKVTNSALWSVAMVLVTVGLIVATGLWLLGLMFR